MEERHGKKMKDAYSILGVSPDATDEEVKAAYRALARKYHPDNFADENPLKSLANEKMQEINAAYDEIQSQRTPKTENKSAGDIYVEIRQKIQRRHIGEAERMLAEIGEFDRTAEWHFLMSVCHINRGRNIDAMRELEIAATMDPANEEYQKAKEAFNTRAGAYGSAYYGDSANGGYRRSDADRACDCCTNLICLDCLCECMGGDLIPCI